MKGVRRQPHSYWKNYVSLVAGRRAPPCFLKVDAAKLFAMNIFMIKYSFIITGDIVDA